MNSNDSSEKEKSLNDLRRLKLVLFGSTIVFLVRYLLLIFSVFFNDVLVIFSVSILFIIQIPVLIMGFILLSYGLMGLKEYLVKKGIARLIKGVVISLMTIIILIIGVGASWLVAGLASFESIPEYGLELWLQSIVIAMAFVELLPLTIGLSLLSIAFWRLRKKEGWKTNILVTPFLFIPLTIVRIIAAIFKIINIIEPLKYPFAWQFSDITRIVYGVIGIIAFIEIAYRFWNIKPKEILANYEKSHTNN